MAIEVIESTNTPNEGREIINDNFTDHEERLNDVEVGVDAFTTTTLSFVQPAAAATVSVSVDNTLWMAVGQPVYMETGGYYTVSSVTDTTTVVLENLGITGNAAPAATVASGKKVSPSGASGVSGASDAADITFTPAGTIAATDVQAAIEEVASEAGGSVSSASETVAGVAELATQTETNTGTDDLRIVTPLKLAGRTASDTRAGVVELATDAEAQTGTDTARVITPANLSARSATETRSGIAEIATQTETDAGTDDVRIVTPLKLVQSLALRDIKDSVRVATTANITLSGTQTIDGVSVVAGNRVLVKDQSTGSQNGIYLCASGSWTRTTDADSSSKVTPQIFTRVEEGTANANKQFYLSNTGAITLGTTALTFTEASSAGHTIQDESTPLTARTNLNFTGAGVTATDDSGNDQTDITIPGKHIVQDEGTPLTARTNLDFAGAGVTVTDNSGSDKTVVTIPAAGPTGDPAYSTTSASFTQPSVAATVSVSVDTTAWMGIGQVVYVVGGGYYTVSSITSGTVVVLNNLGYTGNAAPAATVATAAKVSPGGLVGAAGSSGYKTLVTLGSDVTNSTTTIADITGLSFAVSSGTIYRFYALLEFTAGGTATGIRLTVSGPSGTISVKTNAASSATADSILHTNTLDVATNTSTNSFSAAGNIAEVTGIVRPSAGGTLQLRFASEVAASAIVVKAGSTLEWW